MATIKQAIDNGAYLLMQIDHQKKYTSYSLVTDISESERIIHCELNKSAFLAIKYCSEQLYLIPSKSVNSIE